MGVVALTDYQFASPCPMLTHAIASTPFRFLRGRPELCQHMRRQKVKGTGTKRPVDANSEPNLYAMPPIPASPANVNAGMYSPARAMLPEPLLSHSSPGLHGAAHLLRGFAVGSPVVALPQIPLLGPASVGGDVRALGLSARNRGPQGENDATAAPTAPNTI